MPIVTLARARVPLPSVPSGDSWLLTDGSSFLLLTSGDQVLMHG